MCELLIIPNNIMVFSTVTLDAPALELRSCLSIHEAIDKAYQQGINAKYINQADLDEYASKGCGDLTMPEYKYADYHNYHGRKGSYIQW